MPIRAGADAPEGERKQVTILFADVVGSTALIRGLDEEDAQRLLDGAVQRMVEAVQRYEGTVSRKMGDGLMALFGAPISHEDHAVRACYAALAMLESARRYAEEVRQTTGAAIQIRVGLNSGGVIVRDLSDARHRDYTAMGPTVHLAARMEEVAAPGTALMPSATQALVEGYVESRALGAREVKGFDVPVEVYEVASTGAARTRLQATAARGLTPFVGRDDELAVIDRALARAQSGQGQVVALVAEAGVGKSRLVWEAARSDRVKGARVLQTGALSYGQATAWLPVIDLLRTYFQIESRDDHTAMRDKVVASLRSLDPALEATAPALLALLDVPIDDASWAARDPAQRRRATLDAVRLLLLRESRRQPLLLVFEDLHWLDSESQALLDGLVEALPTARVLLLVNYRPEYSHGWSNKSYYTQLRLDPLGDQIAEELLGALLGSDTSIQPLTALLVQRTEGTPLFLEESVRSLVETGALVGERGAYQLARPVGEVRVPATVQTVLAARIDRLEPEEKRLLQTAAVIGKDVPFVLLQAIAERPETELQARLARLQAGELLYPTALFPELEYTFKHALTHDVAYGSLLHERRKTLHARIVSAIEAEYGDRLDEHVERLAHHAMHAERWEDAVRYSRRAGEKMRMRPAYREATTFFGQALTALQHLPESHDTLEAAFDLRLKLRVGYINLVEWKQVGEQLDHAAMLADRLGDPRRQGWALALRGHYFSQIGDYDRAVELSGRALTVVVDLEDLAVQVLANRVIGQAHLNRGRLNDAIEAFRRNVMLLDGDRVGAARVEGENDDAIISRSWLARCLAVRGEFAAALDAGNEAMRIAQAADDSYGLASSVTSVGLVCLQQGDLPRAIAFLEQSVDLWLAWDSRLQIATAATALASAYASSGRIDDALALIERAAPDPYRMPVNGLNLAATYVLSGSTAEAIVLAERALELSRTRGHPEGEARALRILGEIAARREPLDAADGETHFREALALAEELGMRPLEAHCHLGLGRLLHQAGRLDQARSELMRAVEMLRELGMAFWLPEAETELASASSASVD